MTLDELLPRFKNVRRTPGGYSAVCSAHEDRNNSLSITTGDDGRTLLHCYAGCEVGNILAKVGLKTKDLFSSNGNGRAATAKRKIVATYDYRNEKGELLYQVVRYDPKDFRQRTPKPGGGWSWSVKGIERVPYHLDRIIKADPAIVFIPEGEKDVDRLWAASSHSPGRLYGTCNAGGAGKWDAAWAKHFAGRSIALLPDNDQPGRDHAHDVATKLHGVVASIKIIELPALPEKGDVSDWLDAGGTADQLQTLTAGVPEVTAAQIAEWSTAKNIAASSEDNEDPGRIKTLADAICAVDHFGRDAGGKLYRYRKGVFQPDGERHIKAQVKCLLTEWGETKAWSSRLASEVVEFIRVDAPELPDRPRMDLINVENGMVRVADGVLVPHDPKLLSVVQLPVKHDPAATCPNIESFVAATFPSDAHALAWEIPGVLMVPATWLQKAILLLGEGCNGKSVWLSLIVRFLGKHNVATIPLHRLEADKFSVSRLVGKLANVCADLPSEHLEGTSTFKALTGGDTLSAEYKFRDSFDLDPFARLVFSANHPPRSADSSAAFFRRWLVIPFDHTFGPEEQIPRDILDARLQAPEELSGLFNRALEGLRRVQEQRGFSEPASTREAWRDFHATTDPLAVWLDRYTVDDPDCYVTKQALGVAYNAAVERDGRPAITAKAFGQAVYRLRPNIEEKQRTVGGKFQWCYIGIGLASQNDTRSTRDTLDSPLSSSRTREKQHRGNGKAGVENIEANPVYPVYPVTDCPHADVAETPTHDGYVNRQCRSCGVGLTCRPQEQPA
jgi:putative DNA primase/helicase